MTRGRKRQGKAKSSCGRIPPEQLPGPRVRPLSLRERILAGGRVRPGLRVRVRDGHRAGGPFGARERCRGAEPFGAWEPFGVGEGCDVGEGGGAGERRLTGERVLGVTPTLILAGESILTGESIPAGERVLAGERLLASERALAGERISEIGRA